MFPTNRAVEERLFSDRDLRRLIIPLVIEQFLALFIGMADTVMVSTRRFKAPGGDLSARMLSLPLIFRWLLYYALAAFIFAGFLMNNGYFATAANFLYNNF